MKEKRRDFLKTACAPIVLSVLGVPLAAACSSEDDDENDNMMLPTADNQLEIDLSEDGFSALAEVGGWMNYTAQNLLLVRVSETVIRAFNNACPHEGNRNAWSYDGSEFTCSNHGNSYSDSCDGMLQCINTKLDGNILTVG